MEIRKKIKATPKEMEFLFDTSELLNLKFYETNDFSHCLSDYEYENSRFTYQCIFRIPDELKEEVKKARGNGILKLWKRHNASMIRWWIENKRTALERRSAELKQLEDEINSNK